MSVWFAIAAAGFAASTFAANISDATTHITISLYLSLAAMLFAAFVAKSPEVHARLILNAYLCASVLAAVIGLIGYSAMLPGAAELFTKFGRASATFKDPNVFGAFLVPAVLYALQLWLERPPLRGIPAFSILVLLFAVLLLTFSRGAWAAVIVSVFVFSYLRFVTATQNRERLKLLALLLSSALVALAVVIVALSTGDTARLFEDRAMISQDYDAGPEGRFGGQERALKLAAESPLGIGALEFGVHHHHEAVHNVYLSMFLNAGWLGGILYFGMVMYTLAYGFRHGLRRTRTQPLFLVVYAAFTATALEGLLVDTDHWRHFYLLMGIVWGLMSADRTPHLRCCHF